MLKPHIKRVNGVYTCYHRHWTGRGLTPLLAHCNCLLKWWDHGRAYGPWI